MVLLSYWAFHPYYAVALAQWPNAGMALTLLLLSGGAWYILRKTQMAVSGGMIYGFFLLMVAVVFGTYSASQHLFPGGLAAPLFRFLGASVLLHGAFLLIALFHLALGTWILSPLRNAYSGSTGQVLSLALGISVSGLLLFLLGLGGFLKIWVLWPVVVLVLVLQRRVVVDNLRGLLLRPVALKGESPWSLVPPLLMLVGMAVAQVGMVKAFPMGFDGAALYMNTAHLIAESGGLPRPGQSFNWELFMSMGEILFARIPASIFLSQGAIFFCLLVLYRLGRLFLSRGATWLAVALMYLNPAFSFHVMLDEKVDLGFLFIVLAIVLMVLEYDPKKYGPAAHAGPGIRLGRFHLSGELLMWVLAGWLSGYAFGVKYTGLLAMVGLAAMMAYRRIGIRGAAGLVLVATGMLFLAGINRFGYLDLEGTPGWVFALVSILPGAAMLGTALRRDPEALAWMSPRLGLFGLMALLNFLPWMGKHLAEHRAFSVSNLVQGKPRAIKMDLTGFLEREEARASLPDQMILEAIRKLGVELRPDQAFQVQNVVAQYRFDRSAPAGSRLDQLMAARNQVIRDILDETQRSVITERLARMGMDLDATAGSDVNATYEMLVQNLSRRGLDLNESQSSRLLELINESYLEGRIEPGDRRAIMGLREELFNKILTPEQKDIVSGVRSGELRKSVDGQRYRSSLFSGAQREEIKRYIGYEPGLPLYLSIPYDITMSAQIPFSRYLDISFLFLLLIPFLLLGKNPTLNGGLIALSLLVWVISVYSLYSDGVHAPSAEMISAQLKAQMGDPPGMLAPLLSGLFEGLQKGFIGAGSNLHGLHAALSSLSFIWVYLVLLFMAGVLAWVSRARWGSLPVPLKAMLAFALAFAFLWFFLGNAIVWYGFPFLALLFLLFAHLQNKPEDFGPSALPGVAGRWWTGALAVCLGLSISLFFVSGIQPAERAAMLFNSPFLKHVSQRQELSDTYGQFMPYMDETIQVINADTRVRIYRVGTYFNYHIKRNDRRVFEDNQLGFYEETVTAMRRKEDFVRFLKEHGFRYVLYDLNTTMIDKTPDKSLTRKANDFFLNLANSPEVRPIYTDNFIYDPAVPFTQIGKIRVPGKPGIGGENTMAGSFILFELL
jgi:hypothetical protein